MGRLPGFKHRDGTSLAAGKEKEKMEPSKPPPTLPRAYRGPSRKTSQQSLRSMNTTRTGVSVAPRLKYSLMAEHLQQTMLMRRWIKDTQSNIEGAFVRLQKGEQKGEYVSLPEFHSEEGTPLYQAIAALNPAVCQIWPSTSLDADSYLRLP